MSNSKHEAEVDPTTTNLDKIRDILFGAEVRKHEQRFTRIEEAIYKEIASVRGEAGREREALEDGLRADLEKLQKSLKTGDTERDGQHKDALRSLAELEKTMEKRLATLDTNNSRALRELSAQFAGEIKGARSDARDALAALQGDVEARLAALAAQKVDRLALAELLQGLAATLAKDPKGGTK